MGDSNLNIIINSLYSEVHKLVGTRFAFNSFDTNLKIESDWIFFSDKKSQERYSNSLSDEVFQILFIEDQISHFFVFNNEVEYVFSLENQKLSILEYGLVQKISENGKKPNLNKVKGEIEKHFLTSSKRKLL